MDPGRLLPDDVAEHGEGGQPTGLFGHTLVHLVQKVLRWQVRMLADQADTYG